MSTLSLLADKHVAYIQALGKVRKAQTVAVHRLTYISALCTAMLRPEPALCPQRLITALIYEE